ncbi:hypothetical protein C2E23DRAFT_730601, partial [Lenzites betulinus]
VPDNECLALRSERFREFEAFSRSKSTGATPKNRLGFSGSSTSGSSGSSGSSTNNARLTALTQDDHKVLQENDSCFKCRNINVSHLSKVCPSGFAKPLNYKTPAEQLKATKTSTSAARSAKVAAVIIEDDEDTENFPAVAAVRAFSPLAATSGVLSDGDSSGNDVRLSSLSSPHVTWPVAISCPTLDCTVDALVDTGSPLVLVREDAVTRLQLCRRTLPSPVPLGNAFDGVSVPVREWCKLRVSTPDGLWTSVSVRALIVSRLCAPVILGTPFLDKNCLLVDYANLSARLTQTQYRDVVREFNLERGRHSVGEAPTSIPRASVMAAVRERVEDLAFQEKLKAEDASVKTRFADCFPDDIPHLNELPTDEYHHIRLKNTDMSIVRRQYDCPKKISRGLEGPFGSTLGCRAVAAIIIAFCLPFFPHPKV